MNPYEVLGVDRDATDDEIRNAYRRLIKQFHPDVNKSKDANAQVVLINAAYEILSDPQKRAKYDNGPYVVTAEYEEDPIEAYKREFKRKRWEKDQRAKEKRLKREMFTYRAMRVVAFPLTVFAFLLALDNLLPRSVYQEVAIVGGQQRIANYRRTSRSVLISYIKTPRFFMKVPHDFHLNYPYYNTEKPVVTIVATPIFEIPRIASYDRDGTVQRCEVEWTIHSILVPLPWLLLFSSAFVVSRNEYTMLNYSLCFLPLLLFSFILLVML